MFASKYDEPASRHHHDVRLPSPRHTGDDDQPGSDDVRTGAAPHLSSSMAGATAMGSDDDGRQGEGDKSLILNRAVDFFMDDEFQNDLDAFIDENCHIFTDAVDYLPDTGTVGKGDFKLKTEKTREHRLEHFQF